MAALAVVGGALAEYDGGDRRFAVAAREAFPVVDVELLAEPLIPNFWKVPNDNQYRNNYLNRLGPWRDAAANRTVKATRSPRE